MWNVTDEYLEKSEDAQLMELVNQKNKTPKRKSLTVIVHGMDADTWEWNEKVGDYAKGLTTLTTYLIVLSKGGNKIKIY